MNIEITLTLPAVADNSFYETVDAYLKNVGLQSGKQAEIVLGSYAGLVWSNTDSFPESEVTNWGTKTLPGAGPFYFANHEDGYPTMGHLSTSQPDVRTYNRLNKEGTVSILDEVLTVLRKGGIFYGK